LLLRTPTPTPEVPDKDSLSDVTRFQIPLQDHPPDFQPNLPTCKEFVLEMTPAFKSFPPRTSWIFPPRRLLCALSCVKVIRSCLTNSCALLKSKYGLRSDDRSVFIDIAASVWSFHPNWSQLNWLRRHRSLSMNFFTPV